MTEIRPVYYLTSQLQPVLPVEHTLLTQDSTEVAAIPARVQPGSVELNGPTKEQIDKVLETLGIAWLSEVQSTSLYDLHRLKMVAGGERAGKSFITALFGTTRTPFGSLFWIVGPDYEQCRREFDYWVDFLGTLGAIRTMRDLSVPKIGKASAVTKTGQLIETKTSDEVMKLAGKAPNGIAMVEAAQQSYEAFLKCVGRLAETRGWLFLSGTFEGSEGWYADKFSEWESPDNPEGGVSFSMPTWSNTLVFPGGREDPEILRMERIYSRVPGWFEERLGATPVPPSNLVFRDFRSSVHVGDGAKFRTNLPVYLAIDPSDGSNPYAVLACQFIPHVREAPHPDPIDYCHVIDELYVTGKITEQIVSMAKEKPWWENVKGGAIDVEAPDEKKRWKKYGNVTLHAEKVQVLSGIRRLKTFLHYKRDPKTGEFTELPHLVIHPRVKSLPFEVRKYKRPETAITKGDQEAKTLRKEPPQGQPDHALKALWYLLIARYGEVKAVPKFNVVYNWRHHVAGQRAANSPGITRGAR